MSTVSYSILLNGSPTGLIHPSTGLRQEDSLSPFLFILGSEVLSRFIHKEENLNTLEGINISRGGPKISNLLFADDLICFRKASLSTANIFARCIDTYTEWSRQKINQSKSTIHFSNNISPSIKREI